MRHYTHHVIEKENVSHQRLTMATLKNNFTTKLGDLLPREKMIRASDPTNIDDVALLAVLLKTGTNGCDVVELSRRLIEAFGSLKGLVDADWRRIEKRIAEYNKEHCERPIKGIGRVKCLELSAEVKRVRPFCRRLLYMIPVCAADLPRG